MEERRAELINDKAEKLKAEIWKDVFDSSWTKVEPKAKDGDGKKSEETTERGGVRNRGGPSAAAGAGDAPSSILY